MIYVGDKAYNKKRLSGVSRSAVGEEGWENTAISLSRFWYKYCGLQAPSVYICDLFLKSDLHTRCVKDSGLRTHILLHRNIVYLCDLCSGVYKLFRLLATRSYVLCSV
jgi:hypothetical protein